MALLFFEPQTHDDFQLLFGISSAKFCVMLQRRFSLREILLDEPFTETYSMRTLGKCVLPIMEADYFWFVPIV